MSLLFSERGANDEIILNKNEINGVLLNHRESSYNGTNLYVQFQNRENS